MRNFHAFTIKHNGRARRIITEILVAKAFDPAKHDPNNFEHRPFKALWDTGATGSVITPGIVADLGLRPTGQMQIQHAGGASMNLTYMVNIGLPNSVKIVGLLVSECAAIANEFDAIIGMDIINMGDLSITNADGSTTMSYRLPSVDMIDYVEVADRLRYAGVGRNDPCPCGQLNMSGKPVKFKNCHGRKA
ncbi:MAG: retroviral-like aspartic protease family protein [Candidatus Latescibacterota bacterium]